MKNPLLTPELQELLDANDLETVVSFCTTTHAQTVAECLSDLDARQRWPILRALPGSVRAEVVSHFDFDDQVELVSGQNRVEMARLLEDMAPDDRADLVQRLDPTVREEVLSLVARAEREDIRRLASYEEGTAGAVMSTDYATLRPDMTVGEAIESLRVQAPGKETIYYAYIVDSARRLLGFISLKDLILAKPTETIEDEMHREVISVGIGDDQEEVAHTIEKYDLLAVPVVNEKGMLVGIVTHDDAFDIIRQEQTEDIEKFMAITGSHAAGEYLKTSALRHFSNRVYWLAGLAALGLVSGLIIHSFEQTLTSIIVLALYMPMVADTGGNAGSQSATLVVRALALGEIRPRDAFRVLRKELGVALLIAVVLGLLSFGKVLFISQTSVLPPDLSLVQIAVAIGVALGVQVVTATLIGALLPLMAAAAKLDPAVVASPALTTVVDITGLLIYFGTAKLLLGV